jgi:hypothetical protein
MSEESLRQRFDLYFGTKEGAWPKEADDIFRSSMIELGLLGLLIFLLVYSITLVRRYPPPREFKDL